VGKDPHLFDYFLPERWRTTPRVKLSTYSPIYQTRSKDHIQLVWKISRVGELPDADPFHPEEKRIIQYGYNSPFEEVALAVELMARGIPTIYPRAIYMTGEQTELSGSLVDESRYQSHQSYKVSGDQPILRKDREYILVWGFWNGPDERLAMQDGDYYHGIDALRAYREGRLSETAYLDVMRAVKKRLRAVHTEDLNLRGNHLLLSLDSNDKLVLDEEGLPSVRICNFEMLRRKK